MIFAHIWNIYVVAVSHKVKSFQQTGSFATGSLFTKLQQKERNMSMD